MKLSTLFLLMIAIVFAACNKGDNFEPIEVNNDCSSFIPFYEQHDVSSLSLSIHCNCLDTAVDLSNQLMAYTEVVNVDSGVDYRLRTLEQAELYHYPLDGSAEASLKKSFESLKSTLITEFKLLI